MDLSRQAPAHLPRYGFVKGAAMRLRIGAIKTLAGIAFALGLGACGGGGDETVLQVGVLVAGQPQPAVFPGQPVNLSILAGQSIEFDASEPVQWAFSVNGSPLFTSGTTVVVQGVTITQSDLSPSRVVLDTTFTGPTQLPIFVTLTATSTFDLAQVATVNLAIR
jgi:hypothetical protein